MENPSQVSKASLMRMRKMTMLRIQQQSELQTVQWLPSGSMKIDTARARALLTKSQPDPTTTAFLRPTSPATSLSLPRRALRATLTATHFHPMGTPALPPCPVRLPSAHPVSGTLRSTSNRRLGYPTTETPPCPLKHPRTRLTSTPHLQASSNTDGTAR